ncbi:MAG: hypothetical protein JSV49_06700 [Thermoplasmata archaeon]|nr:MAG: hypothetical protein JSV49_06700 [Thermoplasmata archaeon]
MIRELFALCISVMILFSIMPQPVEGSFEDVIVVNNVSVEIVRIPANVTVEPGNSANFTINCRVLCDLTAQVRNVIVDVSAETTGWAASVSPTSFTFRGTGAFEETFFVNVMTPQLSEEGAYEDTLTVSAVYREDPGGAAYNVDPATGTLSVSVANLTEEDDTTGFLDWETDDGSGILPFLIFGILILIVIILVVYLRKKGTKKIFKRKKKKKKVEDE